MWKSFWSIISNIFFTNSFNRFQMLNTEVLYVNYEIYKYTAKKSTNIARMPTKTHTKFNWSNSKQISLVSGVQVNKVNWWGFCFDPGEFNDVNHRSECTELQKSWNHLSLIATEHMHMLNQGFSCSLCDVCLFVRDECWTENEAGCEIEM